MAFEYLYGTQPVLTALRQRSRRITQLLLYDTERRHQTNPHLGQILALARQYVLPIQHTTRLQLDGLCHQRPHQVPCVTCIHAHRERERGPASGCTQGAAR